MNKFILGALGEFSLKKKEIEYPEKVENIRFSATERIDEYYEKNLKKGCFLLSENCACHIRANKNDLFELTSLSLTCVFVKSQSLKKADCNSFWKYLRIDIDTDEISDIYSHFLPHMHFFEQRFKEKTPEEYRFAVPKITSRIIYDLLNIVYRMANPAEWNGVLCTFAKKQGRSDVAQKIQQANSFKSDIGRKLNADNVFRKDLLDAYKSVEKYVVRCARIQTLDVPISQSLQECSCIM